MSGNRFAVSARPAGWRMPRSGAKAPAPVRPVPACRATAGILCCAVPPFGWDLAVYLASKDRPWFCRSPGFVSFAPSRFRNGMNAKPISTFTVARLRRIHTGFPCSARGKAGHKTYSAVRQKKKPHGQTSASVTDCSHILPSFIPFQGRAPGSHTVGILARASQRATPPAPAPSLLRFPQ